MFRSTATDRKHEAARYREMTEQALITVSLKHCSYDKDRKSLYCASEFFAGSFPSQFFVKSHHTGKDVRFVRIGPEDKLFDQDQWDGEIMIYRPMGNVPNVEYMVVQHEY